MKILINMVKEVEMESPSYFMNRNKAVMVYEKNKEILFASVFHVPGETYWSCTVDNKFSGSEIDGLDECSASDYYDRVDLFLKNFHP